MDYSVPLTLVDELVGDPKAGTMGCWVQRT